MAFNKNKEFQHRKYMGALGKLDTYRGLFNSEGTLSLEKGFGEIFGFDKFKYFLGKEELLEVYENYKEYPEAICAIADNFGEVRNLKKKGFNPFVRSKKENWRIYDVIELFKDSDTIQTLLSFEKERNGNHARLASRLTGLGGYPEKYSPHLVKKFINLSKEFIDYPQFVVSMGIDFYSSPKKETLEFYRKNKHDLIENYERKFKDNENKKEVENLVKEIVKNRKVSISEDLSLITTKILEEFQPPMNRLEKIFKEEMKSDTISNKDFGVVDLSRIYLITSKLTKNKENSQKIFEMGKELHNLYYQR